MKIRLPDSIQEPTKLELRNQGISRTTSKGMLRKWQKRRANKRKYQVEKDRIYYHNLTRQYKTRRFAAKQKYRRRLLRHLYLEYGILKPMGTGNNFITKKPKTPQDIRGGKLRLEEWECLVTFAAFGWNPLTGSVDDQVTRVKRWDMPYAHYYMLWGDLPEDQRKLLQMVRKDPTGSFCLDNCELQMKPPQRKRK